MKYLRLAAVIFTILLLAGNSSAQNRSSQWEVFFGAAFPLEPAGIKDVYKVGVSAHLQYVMFATPRLGISFGVAGEGFTETDELNELGIDSELTVGEIGIGIRPYLSSPESNLQMYLFGMGTYSTVKATFADDFGTAISSDERKPGVAFGAGIEVPFGSRLNLLFQGLARVIFTDTADGEFEHFQFFGLTGGIAF